MAWCHGIQGREPQGKRKGLLLYMLQDGLIVVHFSNLEVDGDPDKIDLGGVVSTETRLERTEE